MKLNHLVVFALLAILSGCATSPTKTTASVTLKPTEAMKIYFDGISHVTSPKFSGDKCSFDQNDSGKSWKSLLRQASACAKNQNWKVVENIAEEMTKHEMNSPWGAYFYSLAAEHTGDVPRAVWMIDLAMKKAQGAALFHYQKGRLMWQLSEHKEAVKHMSAAVELDGKFFDAQMFLAQAHHRNLNYEKAAKHYQSALTVEGSHPICLQGLADVRMAQGKADQAVELLTAAISGNSSSIDLRLRLAQAYEATENDVQALEHYKAVRKLGKVSISGIDVNDKIKTLEAKVVAAQNAQKQAKLQEEAKSVANERKPTSLKGGGK